MSYYDGMPNTINERIDQYANRLLGKLDGEGFLASSPDDLGSEVFYLAFESDECREGGECWPLNDAEWKTLRSDLFDDILCVHIEQRLDACDNPMDATQNSVIATICDMVASRAVSIRPIKT